MFKAGASFHDKYMIGQHLKAGRTPDQISALTSVRVDHVNAVIKQIQDGTLKLRGKAAYLMGQPGEGHPMSGLTPKAQENRMDELSAENAELKAQMAEILSRLDGEKKEAPIEATSDQAPEILDTPIAGDPDPMPDIGEEAEIEQVEAPKPRRRRKKTDQEDAA